MRPEQDDLDTAAPEAAVPAHTFRLGKDFAVAFASGALLGAVLIAAVFTLFVGRTTTPGDTSAEAGFLRDMSSHHAQAVQMAMIAHAHSDNRDIINLSSDIALTQHGQIGTMQAWLRDWNLSPTGTEPVMAWMPDGAAAVRNGLMPGMATADQIAALDKSRGTALDVEFLKLMRQHHLGGIHMAQAILAESKNENVTWLADSMVTGQQGEIGAIEALLKKLQPTA